jgi:hypothetical protein
VIVSTPQGVLLGLLRAEPPDDRHRPVESEDVTV